MRTAILTSALCICDALNPDTISQPVTSVLAVMWIGFIIMDVTDFVNNLLKRDK